MTTVGGFFELEIGKHGAPLHQAAATLTSGRACLREIVRRLRPSRVWVPFYTCDSVVEPIRAEGAEVEDVLVRPGAHDRVWRSARIDTRHTHGTGCTLSSAIATILGRGLPLEQAIAEAREFVRKALLAAPGFGAGHGPMGHQAVR